MTPIHTKNRVIGLLGGSFNPAHEGHLHITLHALKSLHCDEVWWLVSPQNPLKSTRDMLAYEKRLASAREVASVSKKIRVLDIEAQKNLRYTYQTVAYLQRRFAGTHFIWMMGADNLAQFHRWKYWQNILRKIPIMVFDRAPYSHASLRSKTMTRMHKFYRKNRYINKAAPTPSLRFIHLKRHPLSSSQLRKTLGIGGLLRHNKLIGRM